MSKQLLVTIECENVWAEDCLIGVMKLLVNVVSVEPIDLDEVKREIYIQGHGDGQASI